MREYTEKEYDILKATVDLLKQGILPSDLKVAQIAQQANIGKGTVYEYFSTKEEIVLYSVEFMIQEIIRSAYEILERNEKLEPTFYALMELVQVYFEKSWFTISVLVSNGYSSGWSNFLESCKYEHTNKPGIISSLSNILYKRAIDEYEAIPTLETTYIQIALFGVAAGYIRETQDLLHYTDERKKSEEMELLRKHAFSIFIKALT